MKDNNTERINRSIERFTLLQRVMQGQLCDSIHHFAVDANDLNGAILMLTDEVLVDLRAVDDGGGQLLNTEVG